MWDLIVSVPDLFTLYCTSLSSESIGGVGGSGLFLICSFSFCWELSPTG